MQIDFLRSVVGMTVAVSLLPQKVKIPTNTIGYITKAWNFQLSKT